MSARAQRAAVSVGIVVALLVVVGASSHRSLGGGSRAPSLPAEPLLFVVGAGLVLFVALVVAVLLPAAQTRASPGVRGIVRPRPLSIALSLLVPAAVIAIYIGPATKDGQRTLPAQDSRPANGRLHNPGAQDPVSNGRAVGAIAAGVAAAVVGIAAFALVATRRREDAAAPDPRATVAEGAREAAEAAAIPADPRAAVLAAYARMEAALAAVGLARRPSDAPREYLARLQSALGVARAPAALLTELFERARFSPHPIDEDARRQAIVALDALRSDLEPAEAAAP
jgi:hypothetical protein